MGYAIRSKPVGSRFPLFYLADVAAGEGAVDGGGAVAGGGGGVAARAVAGTCTPARTVRQCNQRC